MTLCTPILLISNLSTWKDIPYMEMIILCLPGYNDNLYTLMAFSSIFSMVSGLKTHSSDSSARLKVTQ